MSNSNFSSSIFYDPLIKSFSSVFLRSIFVISTLCYIFLMFLMLTKSQKLQKFKWLLIFYMTSSYLFNLTETFFQLVPLFPAIILQFQPFFGLNSPWLATLGLFCFEFFLHFVVISLVAQIIYKFIKIYPSYGTKTSKMRIFIFVYFITIEIAICGITAYLLCISVNPYHLKEQTEIIGKIAPALKEFVGNSLLIVFREDLSLCFILLAFSLIIYIVIAVLAIIYLRIKINQRRKKLSVTTLKMLNMIFYLIMTEVSCAITFLGIPGILIFLHGGFHISFEYPISGICILITSTHFIIASIATAFSIKPYRQFVLSLFSKNSNRNMG